MVQYTVDVTDAGDYFETRVVPEASSKKSAASEVFSELRSELEGRVGVSLRAYPAGKSTDGEVFHPEDFE